jgi:mannose-6-phosphate isomerase|tara:strand:+ start:7492 stop:7824 length:333 start_codon:yes stop_codon:yes gene_type:complete
MRKVNKKWGHELIWAETANYVGKLLHINAGHRLSLQFHRVKEETVYVLSGTLYIYDDEDKVIRLSPGESFHVNPLQVHRFGANESDVEIMEVSTPHLDDVVRLEDDYGRK